jgi:hypothetical protein
MDASQTLKILSLYYLPDTPPCQIASRSLSRQRVWPVQPIIGVAACKSCSTLKGLYRLRALRFNPAKANKILLAAILPPETIVVCSFRRIFFFGVLIDTADA